jgi:hypothetical protein
VLRANEHVSLMARYGRSYRHPNLEELLFAGPATVGTIAPNLSVRPETGNNVDVGIKVRSARYATSLTYFNNTYHGFISTEIVATTPTGPLSQAINLSSVRIQGVEGDAEVPVRVGGGLLTLLAAVAFTRGEVLAGANPLTGTSLAGTPQDNITPLKVAPGVRFSDARDRFWVEYAARIETKVTRVAPTVLDSPFLIAQTCCRTASPCTGWPGASIGRAPAIGLTFAVRTRRFYRRRSVARLAAGPSTIGVSLRGNCRPRASCAASQQRGSSSPRHHALEPRGTDGSPPSAAGSQARRAGGCATIFPLPGRDPPPPCQFARRRSRAGLGKPADEGGFDAAQGSRFRGPGNRRDHAAAAESG